MARRFLLCPEGRLRAFAQFGVILNAILGGYSGTPGWLAWGVDSGVLLSCERCRTRWQETDLVALAGLKSGYGVLCPNCKAVVEVPRHAHRLRIVRSEAG